MPFVEVSGVRLFYTDEGTGEPPFLLVHGWSCDSHDWSWQIDAFAAGHRVISADNRGHGRSSVPDGGYTPRVFAADLAELLHTLDSGPVVAVGHSLGGLIVSALAVEHPELVTAVVAVDPAYGVKGDIATLLSGFLKGLRGPDGYQVAVAAFDGMESTATPAHLRTWHRRRLLGQPLPVIVDTLSGIYEPEDQFGLRPESDDYLARRRCPVLAVYADAGRAAWEGSIHRHPASRSVAWEDSGHWLHQERPEEFNRLVLQWLDDLPSP